MLGKHFAAELHRLHSEVWCGVSTQKAEAEELLEPKSRKSCFKNGGEGGVGTREKVQQLRAFAALLEDLWCSPSPATPASCLLTPSSGLPGHLHINQTKTNILFVPAWLF